MLGRFQSLQIAFNASGHSPCTYQTKKEKKMYLAKYIAKRLLLLVFTFFIIITICFVLVKLLPNTPEPQPGKDYEIIMRRREMLGYDKPIMEQYMLFWKYAFKGNFGVSEVLYLGQDVWDVFANKIPYTVALNLWATLISIPIGIGLGIFAALKKNKWQDHVISTGVMIFVSVPSFIYAFLVQYILYYRLGWTGAVADALDGAWSWTFFKSIIPAILSMCFGTVAGFTRYTRAELTEVLTNEFMLLARTKGLTRAQATVRHALRNAMVPIFPMILGEFVSLMGGSLIIENIFTIPGTGALYINAIQATPTPDYNFFMLLSAFYILIGLVFGIVVDISYSIIDPRIRMGAK